MDKPEALELLTKKLAEYLELTHADVAAKIGDVECFEATGPSGVDYQMEIQFYWDDQLGGTIRVMGGIDDGGLRAFVPLCKDVLMDPHGPIVDGT